MRTIPIFLPILFLHTTPDIPKHLPTGDSHIANGKSRKIVVVGAGLAGLTAALAALDMGARVEVVSAGQGALSLYPGWLEIGSVSALAKQAGHPYAHAGEALTDGLALLSRVLDIAPGPYQMVTALGKLRAVDVEAGGTIDNVSKSDKVLIVGVEGWRDFFAQIVADSLKAAGYDADAMNIHLPHMSGNFDSWPLEYANWIDHNGAQSLVQQVKPKLDGVSTSDSSSAAQVSAGIFFEGSKTLVA